MGPKVKRVIVCQVKQNPQTSISHWLQIVSFERFKREKGGKAYWGSAGCSVKHIIYKSEVNARKCFSKERETQNLLSKAWYFSISSPPSFTNTRWPNEISLLNLCISTAEHCLTRESCHRNNEISQDKVFSVCTHCWAVQVHQKIMCIIYYM